MASSRSSEPKAEEDAATLELGEFQNEMCLWNAEVDLILTHFVDRMKEKEGEDAATSAMLSDTLKYVRQVNNYTQKSSLESARNVARRDEFAAVDQFEVACLSNLDINDVDEALSLIPSLARVDEDVVARLLEELKTYRTN